MNISNLFCNDEDITKTIEKFQKTVWNSKRTAVIAYTYDYDNRTVHLYSTSPGLLVGLHGKDIDLFKKELGLRIKDVQVCMHEFNGTVVVNPEALK